MGVGRLVVAGSFSLMLGMEGVEPFVSGVELRGYKNTAVFEFVQLVGITSAMYTCLVFLDLYAKGFLFVNFLGRSGVCEPNRRTEP